MRSLVLNRGVSVPKVIHSVPSYKERSYKERLVEMLQSKEQRLVEI